MAPNVRVKSEAEWPKPDGTDVYYDIVGVIHGASAVSRTDGLRRFHTGRPDFHAKIAPRA